MPNHVFQRAELTISDPEVRDNIIALATKGESILKHYLPIAEEGTTQWHTAAIEMWGTKWADYETTIIDDLEGDLVTVRFSSAWSPAEEGIAKLAALLDIHIVLEWEEEQPAFMGAAIFDGKQGRTWSRDYYDQGLDEALKRLGATEYPEEGDIDAINPETGLSPLDAFYQNSSDAQSALRDEICNEMQEHLSKHIRWVSPIS